MPWKPTVCEDRDSPEFRVFSGVARASSKIASEKISKKRRVHAVFRELALYNTMKQCHTQ
jgi:hypothetical protein